MVLGVIQRWSVLRNIRKPENAIKKAQDSELRSAALSLAADVVRRARTKQWLVDDTKNTELVLLEEAVELARQNNDSAYALGALETMRSVVNR